MLTCAMGEIGKRLGLPTQGYAGVSDAKELDAQAGLETSSGALLAALSGINSISGPGLLDLDNGFSLEKLVVDHEICGMALRLARGIEPREDFPGPAAPRRAPRREAPPHRPAHAPAPADGDHLPGTGHRPVERGPLARGRQRDSAREGRRARSSGSSPRGLPRACRRAPERDLGLVMESAARQAGLDALPARENP